MDKGKIKILTVFLLTLITFVGIGVAFLYYGFFRKLVIREPVGYYTAVLKLCKGNGKYLSEFSVVGKHKGHIAPFYNLLLDYALFHIGSGKACA